MNNIRKYVKKYNSLVTEWNEEYGYNCQGMVVQSTSKLTQNIIQEINDFIFSDDFSERRKVKSTITRIGDYAQIPDIPKKFNIIKRELSILIVKYGRKILKESRTFYIKNIII